MIPSPRLVSALLLTALGTACSSPPPANTPQTSAQNSAGPEATLGRIEASKIVYSMRGNEDSYRKCFMRSPHAQGAVTIAFQLDPAGTVTEAGITDSSFPSDAAQDCLLTRLKSQRFSSHSDAREGTWTFVFGLSAPLSDEEREERLEAAEDEDTSAFMLMPGSQGTIDEKAFYEAVEVQYPLYAHCYRDSIERRGESRGLLRLRLSLRASGKIAAIEDAGSILPDPYAVDCMASAFYSLELPAPQGGPVDVEYRLDFE